MRECTVVIDFDDPKRSLHREVKPWLNAQGYRFIHDYTYSFLGPNLIIKFKAIPEEFLTLLAVTWGAREVFK